MKTEVHILLGCADARDLTQAHVDASNKTKQFFLEKNIEVKLDVIRAPGSFITSDVFMDVKRIIENAQRQVLPENYPIEFFVHIQTHGELIEPEAERFAFHTLEVDVDSHSNLNCGMLYATKVAIELEQLLMEVQPKIAFGDEIVEICDESDIVRLLNEKYGYQGNLAGGWIRSIDDLRIHPREQKLKLEQFISQDADLCDLNIQITIGIQDYSRFSYIRLDNGFPVAPFWDRMQHAVRQYAADNLNELQAQTHKQQPLAGLINLTDPATTSRGLAARWYLKQKCLVDKSSYLPNTIFNLSGSAFDLPQSLFGPYMVAGYFFGVKHLKLNDWMVMGNDQAQTMRILKKIANDPLMNFITDYFKVNLIPINHQDAVDLFFGE